VQVCYDLGFPEVSRNLAANGAQVLVVPTMDGYSWGRWEHLQHAGVAPLRAVETRRWVIRAASSGISMLVSPDGTVRKRMGYGEEGVLSGSFGIARGLTFYVRFGFLFSWICLAATVTLAVIWLCQYLYRRPAQSQRTTNEG
jgi:apolipoprotein N-acyltransferase